MIYGLLAPTIIVPIIATLIIGKYAFGQRVGLTLKYETEEDYPDLNFKPVKFKSGKNDLDAFFVTAKGVDKYKAVLIMAHGIGCSRANYMARYEYFAKKGFLVFAYDCTGTCKSEGKRIKGLPQSQVDLENAILYVSGINELKDYKLLVYGHSWGGYAAATVLNTDTANRLTAVATLSGFNDIWNIIYFQTTKYATKVILLAKPWMYLYFMTLYGKRALYKGIDGINKYKGDVLVIHSRDDKTVRFEDSVAIHKDECTNPNAKFVIYEDRGHTLARPIEVESHIKQINKANKTTIKQGKTNIFEHNVNIWYEHVDRREANKVDEKFLDTVFEFYEEALAKAEAKGE